jgi:hypothetical protein
MTDHYAKEQECFYEKTYSEPFQLYYTADYTVPKSTHPEHDLVSSSETEDFVGQRFRALKAEATSQSRINWDAVEEWVTLLSVIFLFAVIVYGIAASQALRVAQ